MNDISQTKTPEKMIEAIFALDLEPIKMKLMDKKEGQGWSSAQADRYELEYKRFLALLAKFPDDVIAPSTSVDKFWHAHILDTVKYARDCESVFGYFLHHYPYFGLRGEQDAANLAKAAIRMRRLYEQEFGAAISVAAGVSWCCKADDKVTAATSDVSWCCKADDKVTAATSDVSWCCKADDKVTAVASDVSWCCKADDKMTAAAGDVSWCCKADDKMTAAAGDVSWCCKASDKVTAHPPQAVV
jgi:hypothetical protein